MNDICSLFGSMKLFHLPGGHATVLMRNQLKRLTALINCWIIFNVTSRCQCVTCRYWESWNSSWEYILGVLAATYRTHISILTVDWSSFSLVFELKVDKQMKNHWGQQHMLHMFTHNTYTHSHKHRGWEGHTVYTTQCNKKWKKHVHSFNLREALRMISASSPLNSEPLKTTQQGHIHSTLVPVIKLDQYPSCTGIHSSHSSQTCANFKGIVNSLTLVLAHSST